MDFDDALVYACDAHYAFTIRGRKCKHCQQLSRGAENTIKHKLKKRGLHFPREGDPNS